MTGPEIPTSLRLVGVSSGDCRDAGARRSSPNPELPRPLLVTRDMVEMIEGWAANAATHGELGAWDVLMATSLWKQQA